MAVLPAETEQRLTVIGEMTAEFAHQVRTPLACAMLYTAQLDTSTPEQKRVVDKITGRLNDLGRMINDMLGFAAGASPPREDVAVADVLDAALRTIVPQLSATTCLSVRRPDASLRIAANKEALKGALMNLINNAEQVCESEVHIELAARRFGDRVLLSVADDGPGVPSDCIGRLFDPFFTTRPQGTGLGLAVVRAVALAHDGDVSVDTSSAGTRFTIDLPQHADRGKHDG